MRRFEYVVPDSLEEAIAVLSEHKDEAKIIAGGQSLIPQLKLRLAAPKVIVDIKRLKALDYIREGPHSLRIGALTTHRTIETSPLIRSRFPVLAEMERRLADVQVRNWGTFGGDICHADPSGDPGPVLVALGAKVRVLSPRGEREIALAEFFVDYLTTRLEADEVLTEIEIPYSPPRSSAVYRKETVRFADFPIASVAALVRLNRGRDKIEEARIVLGGVGSVPEKVAGAEQVLIGKRPDPQLATQSGEAASADISPVPDVHGSEAYKKRIVRLLTEEMVNLALRRAQEA